MTQFGSMKNIAEIGDLVEVAGYYGDLFVVESWTHELSYEKGAVIESIIYDLTDVDTYEFLIAYQEDITVIEKAKNAWEELDEMRKNHGLSLSISDKDIKTFVDDLLAAGFLEEENNSNTIDYMLDEINDYKALTEMFGDESGEYRTKIERTKKRLRKITQKEADK